ncbi:MAG: hypothetical protein FJ333_10020 [Sphingomonadales bacterium]|nr:hypothetical protein [Sphingomonadales bacterium]
MCQHNGSLNNQLALLFGQSVGFGDSLQGLSLLVTVSMGDNSDGGLLLSDRGRRGQRIRTALLVQKGSLKGGILLRYLAGQPGGSTNIGRRLNSVTLLLSSGGCLTVEF